MKKMICLLSCSLLLTMVFAQQKIKYQDTIYRPAEVQAPSNTDPVSNVSVPPTGFDCTPLNSVDDNLVLNPRMLTNASFPGTPAAQANAFGLRYVDYWLNSHGAPSLNDWGGPYSGNNVAHMTAFLTTGEGIAAKIQPLVTGHNYMFNFTWSCDYSSSDPDFNDRDFNIYLINCSNVSNFPNGPTAYPAIPANSQRIFCDHNFWFGTKQQTLCFSAASNYDMIWIFPKKNGTPFQLEVGFYAPLLVEQSSFQVLMASTSNPCIRILSPSIVIPNATYQWRLNGTNFSTQQNPQIDVSTQNGTIQCVVTGPNTATTSTCSQSPCGLTASLVVSNDCMLQIDQEMWTWMNGSNTVNQPGIYGTVGVPAAANTPGAQSASMAWAEQSGNLWLFGGGGYNAGATRGLLNDLWKYNIATNQWTWMKGTNLLNQFSVYGTMGVPAAANKPGGRDNAQTWTDASGNLWLYGGWGNNPQVDYEACHSDLWKYTVSTNNWTWVNGSSSPSQPPVFGTLGVPSSTNSPGCKGMAPAWTDASGNFWLYSGLNATGTQDDLWKYIVSTNQWTWVKGNHTVIPVYGTKGVAAAANNPGQRNYSITWTDASGNLWLFGGEGYNPASTWAFYNDLWKYNIATNMWTWVSGDNGVDHSGVYGTKGVAAATNKPGARRMAVSWIDLPHGNLFLYGGQGYTDGTTVGNLSDLWKYNLTSNQWTWVSGSNLLNASAFYGTLGVAGLKTKPGARSSLVSWRDAATGTLWLLGGMDGSNNITRGGLLNDLWKYNNPTTGQCCLLRSTTEPQTMFGSDPSVARQAPFASAEMDLKDKLSTGATISSIELYNLNGQLVKVITNKNAADLLVNNNKVAGLNSGLYLLRITFSDKTIKTVKKLL